MALHVVGGSGFIGQSILREIQIENEKDFFFYSSKPSKRVGELQFDLDNESTWNNIQPKQGDSLIYLSWKYLDDYHTKNHLSFNLTQSIRFLSSILEKGISRLIVTGTCYEYGMQVGKLSEGLLPKPITSYGISKDLLRRALEVISNDAGVDLVWLRLFFPYGAGQNPNSLLPSLQRAIDNGDRFFNIGSGELVRDFVDVKIVAKIILKLAYISNLNGIYNLGSGIPMTVSSFVEKYIQSRNANMQINPGVFPDRTFEPESFWADISKIQSVINR